MKHADFFREDFSIQAEQARQEEKQSAKHRQAKPSWFLYVCFSPSKKEQQ